MIDLNKNGSDTKCVEMNAKIRAILTGIEGAYGDLPLGYKNNFKLIVRSVAGGYTSCSLPMGDEYKNMDENDFSNLILETLEFHEKMNKNMPLDNVLFRFASLIIGDGLKNMDDKIKLSFLWHFVGAMSELHPDELFCDFQNKVVFVDMSMHEYIDRETDRWVKKSAEQFSKERRSQLH